MGFIEVLRTVLSCEHWNEFSLEKVQLRTVKVSRLAQLYRNKNQISHAIPSPEETLLVAIASCTYE